ncbi:MAG: sigma 54-interacting transcriptional regulator, partial [Phycisphaerae bacterium]
MIQTAAGLAPVIDLLTRSSEAPVLLQGPHGTTKELLAHVLHDHSIRVNHPFVILDCQKPPPARADRELWSLGDLPGLRALVQGGTLLLKHVHTLSPLGQTRLLDLVENQSTTPADNGAGGAGGSLGLRLVTTCDVDLAAVSKAGNFRSDLLLRLNVLALDVPADLTRREDIDLVLNFLADIVDIEAAAVPGDRGEAWLRRLRASPAWSDDLRDLVDATRRALILGPADGQTEDVLPLLVRSFRRPNPG